MITYITVKDNVHDFLKNFTKYVDLCALLEIKLPIANICTRWRGVFKGLSQHGKQANFVTIFLAAPFEKNLPIYNIFCDIYLARQYF
jgi:hypothetical protein